MNPKLLVKITVPRTDNKTRTGTGYAIAPGLVLTAYHVVDFAERDKAQPIKLEWTCLSSEGNSCETSDVRIKPGDWLKHDIALLECKFPAAVNGHVPAVPVLAAQVASSPDRWVSAGYPKIHQFRLKDATGEFGVDLGQVGLNLTLLDSYDKGAVPDDLVDTGWGGMSGAPVFEAKSRRLQAVVINHNQWMQKQLVAVSIPWLLQHDDAFKALLGVGQVEQDFSQAIAHLDKAHEARHQLLVNLAEDGFELEDSAIAVVGCLKAIPIHELLQRVQTAQQQTENKKVRQDLGILVRRMLPAFYDDSCIARIRQERGCSAGMIQIPFATEISAEILMASADRREAEFKVIPYEYGPIAKAGKYRLPLPPESGPDDGEQQFQDVTFDLYNRLGRGVNRSVIKRVAEEKWFSLNKAAPPHPDVEVKKKFLQAWLAGNAAKGRPGFYWLVRKGSDATVNASLDALVNELQASYPHITFLCLEDDNEKLIHETYTVFNQLADTLQNG